MKILFFGDIVGRPGREAILENLHNLRLRYQADVCIANCENAAGGFGITREHAGTLLRAGVDLFTTGNHVWSKKEVVALMEDMPILRPHNLPGRDPGTGVGFFTTDRGEKLAVINLVGRVYMDMPASSPFETLDNILKTLDTPHILVDFHAEATSEKKALGFYADGRVSAVLGTHTHVQTADEQILPGGTAYISDVGMCGALHSVLGVDVEIAVQRFTSSVRRSYAVAHGAHEASAVLIETNDAGRAVRIERIQA
ncbi:MAG: TIGR00282 family metallophosphoesterase [Ruminococcaceae bacterium]|nr:TIGR00282 family metallophosphoesterase [Oscillospiraceae bacterium]